MNSYRLENEVQDKEFLAGKRVICRAVLEKGKLSLHAGDFILVQLSNGKKYKGKIVEFRSFPVDNYLAGDLVMIRI